MGILSATNTLGLICSLVCIFLFFLIAFKDSKLMDRITLRLQVALSVVDLFGHVLLYIHEGKFSKKACSLVGFAVVYQNSVYVIIVFFITLILHLNFLTSKKFHVKYEKYVWIMISILPLIQNIPPYALDIFGLENHGFCIIDTKKPNHQILFFTNMIGPRIAVFLYSLATTLIILYKVKTDCSLTNRVISTHGVNDPISRRLLQKLLQNWIIRLIMYPIAFCLKSSGFVVDFSLQMGFGYMSVALFYWTAISGRLSGLFNLLAFLVDPYFQYAFKRLLQSYQKKDTIYPASLASEAHSHEIKMSDFNDMNSGPSHSQSTSNQDENLNKDEAVALLHGYIKNC